MQKLCDRTRLSMQSNFRLVVARLHHEDKRPLGCSHGTFSTRRRPIIGSVLHENLQRAYRAYSILCLISSVTFPFIRSNRIELYVFFSRSVHGTETDTDERKRNAGNQALYVLLWQSRERAVVNAAGMTEQKCFPLRRNCPDQVFIDTSRTGMNPVMLGLGHSWTWVHFC